MSLPDGIIRERTRQYGVTDDPFVGLPGSFQYAENLNVFDDPRGIKLTTGWSKSANYKACKLVSAGDYVIAIPNTGNVTAIKPEERPNGTSMGTVPTTMTPRDAVVFGNSLFVIGTKDLSSPFQGISTFRIPNDDGGFTPEVHSLTPIDYTGDNPILMGNQDPNLGEILPPYCDCICNFNDSMLLVGNGNYLRVYNPADDLGSVYATGWKIVKKYAENVDIIEISPKADYVEIFLRDGVGNTKIHYYPGIFDMEDSGLMKSVELPNTRVLRVYPHMTKEMIITTYDGSNNNVSLREVIGYETYPVMRSHRAGLSPYDVQHKLGFFTGPCGYDMAWYEGRAYVADVEGIREFNWYDANKMPVGNLRWKFYDEDDDKTPFGLAVAKDYIFVTYNDYAYCMRIYDTANPYGYAQEGMLISRAIETEYGGEFTKHLVRWITQFEMNNLTNKNGSIDIYACGNREWNSPNDDCWIKIAHIEQADADFVDEGETSSTGLTQYGVGTCVHRFDNAGDWGYMRDWQVIEYKVVITRGEEQNASPVLRSLLLEYDVKEKTNYF